MHAELELVELKQVDPVTVTRSSFAKLPVVTCYTGIILWCQWFNAVILVVRRPELKQVQDDPGM